METYDDILGNGSGTPIPKGSKEWQEQQQDGQDFPGRQVRQTARLLSVDRRIPAPCRMGKWRAGGDQLGG